MSTRKKRKETDEVKATPKRAKTAKSKTDGKEAKSDQKTDARDTVVLSVGSGDISQLGLGDEESMRQRKFPTVIKTLEHKKVTQIAAGNLHNAVVTHDGQVFSWGCNDDHALGHEEDEWLPTLVKGVLESKKVQLVVCGGSHTAALCDGVVYSWGQYRDLGGPMGFSEKEDVRKAPGVILELKNDRVVSLACGDNHDLALSAKGVVYQWGDIGLGRRSSDRKKKTKLKPRTVTFKKQGKQFVHVNVVTHVYAGDVAKPEVVGVFAGGSTSFAVDRAGHAWVWGPNNYGQCGLPNSGRSLFVLVPTVIREGVQGKLISAAAATHHSLLLNDQGHVFSFGRGESGRLGLGDTADKAVPTQVPFPAGVHIVQISCGEGHSLALTRDGRVYSWGYGDLLQLGTGEEKDVLTPVLMGGQQLSTREVLQISAGSQHSLILAVDRAGASSSSASKSAAKDEENENEDDEKDKGGSSADPSAHGLGLSADSSSSAAAPAPASAPSAPASSAGPAASADSSSSAAGLAPMNVDQADDDGFAAIAHGDDSP